MALRNYQIINKDKYSLARNFPFELSPIRDGKKNILFVVMIIASIILLNFANIFVCVSSYNIETRYQGTMLLTVASSFIASISFIYLLFSDTKNFKMHLLALSFLIAFALANVASIAYIGYASLLDPSKSQVDLKKLIVAIIATIEGIVMLLLFINPKIKSWFKLEEIKNDDGTITHVRPKIFILALIEWSYLFALLLSGVLFLLLMI